MKEIGHDAEYTLRSWSEQIDAWLDEYDSYEAFMKNYPSAAAGIEFKQFGWFAALRKWEPEEFYWPETGWPKI